MFEKVLVALGLILVASLLSPIAAVVIGALVIVVFLASILAGVPL